MLSDTISCELMIRQAARQQNQVAATQVPHKDTYLLSLWLSLIRQAALYEADHRRSSRTAVAASATDAKGLEAANRSPISKVEVASTLQGVRHSFLLKLFTYCLRHTILAQLKQSGTAEQDLGVHIASH